MTTAKGSKLPWFTMATAERMLIGEQRFSFEALVDLRRMILHHARSIPPGSIRNQYRQIAVSLRSLLENESWLRGHVWNAEKS